jgi:hypothetical protein
MDRVIHAVLTKKDIDLNALQDLPGLEWLSDPRVKVNEVVSLAKADKHIVKGLDEFKDGSIQSYSIPTEGVRILAGILKSDEGSDNIELCDGASPADTKKKKPDEKTKKDEEVAEVDEKKVSEMIATANETLKTEITDLFKTEIAAVKEEIVKASGQSDGTGSSAASPGIGGELDASGKKIEDGTGGGADGKAKKDEEVEELKASVEKLSAELTKTSEDLAKIQKSEKTSAGSKGVDDLNDVTKDDKNKSPWKGMFLRDSNPKVQAILNA